MRLRRVRVSWVPVSALGVLLAFAACAPEDRVPVAFKTWTIIDGELVIMIDTCNGDPEVTELVEGDAAVTIGITSTRRNPGDGCQDRVEVTLSEPLGSRTVIDESTGREVEPTEG